MVYDIDIGILQSVISGIRLIFGLKPECFRGLLAPTNGMRLWCLVTSGWRASRKLAQNHSGVSKNQGTST